MSEVLEGVLSEAMLDELASDLGIEANVLRKHPFFRVLKGRVLLTYPLRVSEPQFKEYSYREDLAHGAIFIPPAGTIIFTAVLQSATVDAHSEFYVRGHGTQHIADAFLMGETNAKTAIARVIYCDGTYVGFYNNCGATRVLSLWGVTLTE